MFLAFCNDVILGLPKIFKVMFLKWMYHFAFSYEFPDVPYWKSFIFI